MYASYHFSHPILTERLAALGWDSKKVAKSGKAGKGRDEKKAVKAADREL